MHHILFLIIIFWFINFIWYCSVRVVLVVTHLLGGTGGRFIVFGTAIAIFLDDIDMDRGVSCWLHRVPA